MASINWGRKIKLAIEVFKNNPDIKMIDLAGEIGVNRKSLEYQLRKLGIKWRSNKDDFIETAQKYVDSLERPVLEDYADDPKYHEKQEENTWEVFYTGPTVKSLEDLIEHFNIDMEIWECERFMPNAWQMGRKGEKKEITYGEGVATGNIKDTGGWAVVTLYQAKAIFIRKKPIAVQPVIQPVRLATLTLPKIRGRRKRKYVRAFFFGDTQIGFVRNIHTGKILTTTHDREAMDIYLQIISDVQPERLVIGGDFLDMTEWTTRWVVRPEFFFTTQPSLISGLYWLSEYRKANPNMTIDALEGNHHRFKQAMIAHMRAAYELRPADHLEGWPVLSLPYLLGMEELGISFHEGYQDGYAELELSETLRTIHGDTASSVPLKTVQKISRYTNQHTVVFHIHRQELITEPITYNGVDGSHTTVCPGASCKTDGSVPGSKKRNGWQVGALMATYCPDEPDVHPEFDLITVNNGVALYNGTVYRARHDLDTLMNEYLMDELSKINVSANYYTE